MLPSNPKAVGSVRSSGQQSISVLLKTARAQRGISQYELAAMLASLSRHESVTRAEVARWERARRIPGPYWRRWLAQALDLPAEQLVAAARWTRSGRRKARNQAAQTRAQPGATQSSNALSSEM